MEDIMGNMSPPSTSGSSVALSITAAVVGLLVLLTLLVGGPVACVCLVAMRVKKMRKRAKRTRGLIFASQWRAQNPFLPFPHFSQCADIEKHAQEEAGKVEALEAGIGNLDVWPCFSYTAIPDVFNGLSTAFFQSPAPNIFRDRSGSVPEIIRFNPGIGSKRQEQCVQCSHPLLSGLLLPSKSPFAHFEVTIIGFSKEKHRDGVVPAISETKITAAVAESMEETVKPDRDAILCVEGIEREVPSEESVDSSNVNVQDLVTANNLAIESHREGLVQSMFGKSNCGIFNYLDKADKRRTQNGQNEEDRQVRLEGTLAIGLAAHPAPPFRLPGRDAVSIALHSKSGRLFVSDSHEGKPFAAPSGWGRVGMTVGCGFDMATNKVSFTIEGICYKTDFEIVPNASDHNGDDEDKQTEIASYDPSIHPLFPTIGADCDVTVRVNIGQETFKYGR
ncbi:hypothetical protein KP509_09G015700 [Ceratopteris richardii]|uniref:SPRY domain-containing protein n=1 Tax=Ceratopteris richardii TaxID=49495 RepID=A0A8T2U0I0_CERRI|nr:hypothetical protein KP509_09G015700 [Ceratopteris richardii]